MIRRNMVVAGPGDLQIVDEELAPLEDGQLLLETVVSGLSAGTELTFLKGNNPALHSRLDGELGLFVPDDSGDPEFAYPVTRLGYMEVARVAESRTPAFAVGDLVATPYGHATHHVSDPVREHVVPLPADLDPVLGVFVAHLGPICVNGLLHAAADATGGHVSSLRDGVDGRLVVVTGGGAIGLLVGLLAQQHGAAEVVVLDADPRRRAAAEALGLAALDLDDDPGLVLKTRWRHGPADHGADVVLQCRGREEALQASMRCLRPQGTVVDLAFYPGNSGELHLGEEFHHNGLRLVCAQIGRVPRGLATSWDRRRLSWETLSLLQAKGDLIREHVVTEVVPFDEAPTLMRQVADRERHVVSAVFSFLSSGVSA